MAQFAAQGRLKLLFSNDGDHYKLVGNAFVGGSRSFQVERPRVELFGSRTGKCASGLRKKSVVVRARSYHGGKRSGSKQTSSSASGESEDDDADEFGYDDLASFRGLVLDISYRPITVVCWKRAICLEFMEKADVLEYYDQTVNSPSGCYNIPAVLRVPHLLQVVKRIRSKHNLSRKNILYRDNYTCQYCSSQENLTIDHVFPMSRGGEWEWDNLVTACAKCNSTKGKKTVEEANMTLLKQPKAPKDYDILAIPLTAAALRMLNRRKGTPEEWRQYIS